ncbi:MAG: bifunctional hydroxymethylpyrimidine kinase/phosphomethylpyrimidine kinase, partial [Bacteroidetes bacterium]|nr:bifunctional hydroxymethylpyrimidine kinase/phosphomethylpyrimidine kinase [Bacteroidota bacterium]
HTPNETEAEWLTGLSVSDEESAWAAARSLHTKGVQNVVITLGARGALLYSADRQLMVPAPPVTPLDTTAAGDVFNGALVVALAEQKPLPEAIQFACQAAALSVTRMGAQASIPQRAEVDELISNN